MKETSLKIVSIKIESEIGNKSITLYYGRLYQDEKFGGTISVESISSEGTEKITMA